jgi:hypothetical protein
MTGKLSTSREQFTEFVKPMDRDKLRDRAVALAAAIGCVYALVSGCSSLIGSDHPVDPTPGNSSTPDSSLVAGFAQNYVTTFLTAKAGDENNLLPFVSVKNPMLPDVATAATFDDATVNFVKERYRKDGVSVWSATVSGIVDARKTTTPQRTYYSTWVVVYNHTPRAFGRPSPTGSPGLGIDARPAYRYDVAVDSALGRTVAGFINAYLTGGNDFARFVTKDITDKPVKPAPFHDITVQSIRGTVDQNGAGASAAEVYVTYAARTTDNLVTQFDTPLTLRTVEGTWQVSAITTTPDLELMTNGANATPSTTPTSSAPPPPPPTRG